MPRTTLDRPAARSSRELLHQMREDIVHRRYGDDGYLGTEVDMARRSGLSRMTVRKAVDALAFEGLIERRVAKGIFVRANSVLHGIVQVVVPTLEQQMPRAIIRGARLRARRTETCLLVFDADFAVEHELRRLRQLPESGARGAILVSPHEMPFQSMLRAFDAVGFPYVLVDDHAGGPDAAVVLSDNTQGGYVIGQALVRRGYRRAALLHDETIHTARQRRDGLLHALGEAGIPFDPGLYATLRRPPTWRPEGMGQEHWTRAAMAERIGAWMASPGPPDVFVCENDYMARDAMDILQSLGLRIPDDVGLTGFDRAADLERMRPRLATVEQDMVGLGEAAMAMLVERVTTGRRPDDRVLPVKWIDGETLRPPR